MYLCYIDESGDCGAYDPKAPQSSGTQYFIFAALLIHVSKWNAALDQLKSFRKRIARQSFLRYDIEFHCAEMIDPRKTAEYRSISVADRWQLIEEYAETIGLFGAFSIIPIVLNKAESTLQPTEYLEAMLTEIYTAFDGFLKEKDSRGMVFLDRANEKRINTHVRRLMGTGASGETIPGRRLGWIIEDPIFRVSSDSMFIQSADVIAYTVKEHAFPQAARKKFNADRIFRTKLGARCVRTPKADDLGVIWV